LIPVASGTDANRAIRRALLITRLASFEVAHFHARRGCEFIRRTAFSGRRCHKNACDFDALKRASYILSQPRRVDKSMAGGVSHQYANITNQRPGGRTQGRMCRPFRPESQCFLLSGGLRHRQRMCRASSPGDNAHCKTDASGRESRKCTASALRIQTGSEHCDHL
jgi:hypothetical protein